MWLDFLIRLDEAVVDTVGNKQTVMKANIIKACDSDYKYPLNPHTLSEESRQKHCGWMSPTVNIKELFRDWNFDNNDFLGCLIGGFNKQASSDTTK